MDTRSIKNFVHVADVGSITLAANELGIVQPALSRQIRKMEKEVGAVLFERLPRGVQLTSAGRHFLDHCRRIMHQIAAAKEDIALTRGAPGGQVTFGFPGTLTPLVAPRLVKNIREKFPQLSLKIIEGPSALLHEALVSGRIQAAVLNNPPASGSIEVVPLISELMVVFSPSQRGSVRGFYTLAELAQTPLVMTSGIRAMVDDQIAARGKRLNVEFEIDSVEAIRQILLNGAGTTVLPVSALRDNVIRGDVSAYPIADINLHRMLAVAFLRSGLTASVQAVINATQSEMNALAAAGIFSSIPEYRPEVTQARVTVRPKDKAKPRRRRAKKRV
jgi:LysR family nitrogen assimilation transcriptional regulator